MGCGGVLKQVGKASSHLWFMRWEMANHIWFWNDPWGVGTSLKGSLP